MFGWLGGIHRRKKTLFAEAFVSNSIYEKAILHQRKRNNGAHFRMADDTGVGQTPDNPNETPSCSNSELRGWAYNRDFLHWYLFSTTT